MNSQSPAWPSTNAMLGVPPDRLIAWARATLAGFALVAIYLDPSQPAYRAQTTYLILLVYVVYSAVLVALPALWTPSYRSVIVHAADIGIFALLMQLTEGPTSPFFVFFTFALLSGTLQWNSRGAIWTTVALIVSLGLLSWSNPAMAGSEDELNRLIMRAAYLLVAGAMLAYFGAFRERDRLRLAKLAAWPQEAPAIRDAPVLDRSLAHAADVLGAKRVLVAWEEAEEPFWYTAYWDGQSCRSERVPWADFGPLMPGEPRNGPFMATASGASQRAANGGAPTGLSEELIRTFDIKDFVAAPFQSTHHAGHVFVLDPQNTGPGLLALSEIVASRIAAQLEHHSLGVQIANAALVGERERIARDIHDGLLQDLTAAQMRLPAGERTEPAPTEEDLAAVKHILLRQQKRIRTFVEEVRAKPGANQTVSLQEQIDSFVTDLRDQWDRRIDLDIDLGELVVSQSYGAQLCFILAEAVANGVKHGGATAFELHLRSAAGRVEGRIKDNGMGIAALQGAYSHQDLAVSSLGPSTILRRVEALDGELSLRSAPDGVQLDFRVPLP